MLNRALKASPIRGLMEPRQGGLSPISDGFVLRGFWQTDKSFEIPSREGGAADVEGRPAGGVKERCGLGRRRRMGRGWRGARRLHLCCEHIGASQRAVRSDFSSILFLYALSWRGGVAPQGRSSKPNYGDKRQYLLF